MPQQAASHEEKLHPEQGKVSKEHPVPSPQHTSHLRCQGRMLWEHWGGSASHCHNHRRIPTLQIPCPGERVAGRPLNRWSVTQTLGLCDTGLVEVEQGALEWLIYQKEARRRAQRRRRRGPCLRGAARAQQAHGPCWADGTVVTVPIWPPHWHSHPETAAPTPARAANTKGWSGEEGGSLSHWLFGMMLQILQEMRKDPCWHDCSRQSLAWVGSIEKKKTNKNSVTNERESFNCVSMRGEG